ncbi:hypothetical protein V8F33_008754 [Rhypophila sp. PSN 637]
MASTTLQGIPVEMIHEVCGHLEFQDLRTLRRVNRYFCAIASSHTLKRIKFCMCKRDLDMLRQITNNPLYASYIQGLVYVVDTLSLERQTFEMYARAIERNEMIKRHIGGYVSRARVLSPPRTYLPSEIRELHRRYTQFFEQQQDILHTRRDFEVIKEVISKLPNLKEISVSSDGEIAKVKKSPFVDCKKVCDGRFVGDRMSTRHLEVMLKGIKAAGTQLQTMRVSSVYHTCLDPTTFGLHSIADQLGNMTHFDLAIQAVEESHMPMPLALGSDDPFDISDQLSECNKTMQAGGLRRVLERMPNLIFLRLAFIELHSALPGTFEAPAILQHVMPHDAHWPKLKCLSLSNLMTERQYIVKLLARHKDTLQFFRLDQMRLLSTSWMVTLPMLRKLFFGTQMAALVTDFIISVSEDGNKKPEAWQLGNPEYDSEHNDLGDAVTLYITSKKKQECPLTEDNMFALEEWDEDDEVDVFGSVLFDDWMDEEDELWEDELEDDDELPDLIPID